MSPIGDIAAACGFYYALFSPATEMANSFPGFYGDEWDNVYNPGAVDDGLNPGVIDDVDDGLNPGTLDDADNVIEGAGSKLDWSNTSKSGQTALDHIQKHATPNYQRDILLLCLIFV